MSLALNQNQENVINSQQKSMVQERDPLSVMNNNLMNIQQKNKKESKESIEPARKPRRSVSFNSDIKMHKIPKNKTATYRKEDIFQSKKSNFYLEASAPMQIEVLEPESKIEQQQPQPLPQNLPEFSSVRDDAMDDLTDNITADMSITQKIFEDDDQEMPSDDSSCFTFADFGINTIPITTNITGDSQSGSTNSSGVNCTELYGQGPATENFFLNITQSNATTKHLKTKEIFDNLNEAKNLLLHPVTEYPEDNDDTNFFQDTVNMSSGTMMDTATLDLHTINPGDIKAPASPDVTTIIEEDEDEDGTANFLLKESLSPFKSHIPESKPMIVETTHEENKSDISRRKKSRLSMLLQNYTIDEAPKESRNQYNDLYTPTSDSSSENISVEDFLCLGNIHFGNILTGRKTSVCVTRGSSYFNKENVDPNSDYNIEMNPQSLKINYTKEKLCYQPKYQLLENMNNNIENEIKSFQTQITELSESLSKHNPECFGLLLKPKSSKATIQTQTLLKRLKQSLKSDSKLTWYAKNRECSLSYHKHTQDLLQILLKEKDSLQHRQIQHDLNSSELNTSVDESNVPNSNEKYVNKLEEQIENDGDMLQILKGFFNWKLVNLNNNQLSFEFPYSYRLSLSYSEQTKQVHSIKLGRTQQGNSWKDEIFDKFIGNTSVGRYLDLVTNTKMLPQAMERLTLWMGRATDLIDEISELKNNIYMQIKLSEPELVATFNTHTDSRYLPFSVSFGIDITTYPYGNLTYSVSLPEEQQSDDNALDNLQHGINLQKLNEIMEAHAPPRCSFGRLESICNFLSDLLQ